MYIGLLILSITIFVPFLEVQIFLIPIFSGRGGFRKLNIFWYMKELLFFLGHHITRLFLEGILYSSTEGTCGKNILPRSHDIVI